MTYIGPIIVIYIGPIIAAVIAYLAQRYDKRDLVDLMSSGALMVIAICAGYIIRASQATASLPTNIFPLWLSAGVIISWWFVLAETYLWLYSQHPSA